MPFCDLFPYGFREGVNHRVRLFQIYMSFGCDEMAEFLPAGETNVVQGQHLGIDTANSLIYGPPNKRIVTIGLRDFVVVDTPDALLVCPASRSQDVKKVVDLLAEDGADLL